MVLFVVTLALVVAGLLGIEFGQPSRPRDFMVWNDDIERSRLRQGGHSGLW